MSCAELEGKEVGTRFGRERRWVQLGARWAQMEMPSQELGVTVCSPGDRCRLGDTAVRVGSILWGLKPREGMRSPIGVGVVLSEKDRAKDTLGKVRIKT